MNTPTIDKIIVFMNTAGGRDNVNATVQMFFRFLIQYNESYKSSKKLLKFLNCCSSNIGNGRKFIKLGAPIQSMRDMSKAMVTKDQFLKFCLVGNSTCNTINNTLDMIGWVHSSGIQKLKGIDLISHWMDHFWLYALLFNIAGETYKLFITLKKIVLVKRTIQISKNKGEINTKAFKELLAQRKARKMGVEIIFEQLLEVLDVLSSLKYIDLSPKKSSHI
jgi:hypothetical protein